MSRIQVLLLSPEQDRRILATACSATAFEGGGTVLSALPLNASPAHQSTKRRPYTRGDAAQQIAIGKQTDLHALGSV